MSSGSRVATLTGHDLTLELLDPGSEVLVRLFRHPGGEWGWRNPGVIVGCSGYA